MACQAWYFFSLPSPRLPIQPWNFLNDKHMGPIPPSEVILLVHKYALSTHDVLHAFLGSRDAALGKAPAPPPWNLPSEALGPRHLYLEKLPW